MLGNHHQSNSREASLRAECDAADAAWEEEMAALKKARLASLRADLDRIDDEREAREVVSARLLRTLEDYLRHEGRYRAWLSRQG